MTRRILTLFPIFALHKSPTSHNRQPTNQAGTGPSTQELLPDTRGLGRPRDWNNGAASPASDAPDDLRRARGGRGWRRHLLLLRRRKRRVRRQQVLHAQQLVVAPLRSRPRLALAVDPRVLAEPLQESRGRHGAPHVPGGTERHCSQIGRRAIVGAEVSLSSCQLRHRDHMGIWDR